MLMKRSFLLFLAIHLISSKKETEQCLLNSLKQYDNEFLHRADLIALTTSVLDFTLFPKSLKAAFERCNSKDDEALRLCEAKHGEDRCERCGMLWMPKCPKGFAAIDCGLCARVCPHGTLPDAAGALCQKPKLKKKQIFSNVDECKSQFDRCENHWDFATNVCDDSFRSVGYFLCTYSCPEGFEDENLFCVPETVERLDYYMTAFEGERISRTE